MFDFIMEKKVIFKTIFCTVYDVEHIQTPAIHDPFDFPLFLQFNRHVVAQLRADFGFAKRLNGGLASLLSSSLDWALLPLLPILQTHLLFLQDPLVLYLVTQNSLHFASLPYAPVI
jgi:hypothetical protein